MSMSSPGAPPSPPSEGALSAFAADFERLAGNIERVIRGKADVVRRMLTCFFAEGHLLIEDVPGVGKTSLARALAASFAGTWRRIQFTPDLLPSDVTGVTIFDQRTFTTSFHEGGVFANIVLADEVNRASPKTQAALLEVMEERRVTVDSIPHDVPRPFVVVATQNPVEMDGTYPLPEAQLDRFLMRIDVGYPDPVAEREILSRYREGHAIEELPVVLDAPRVTEMIAVGASTHVDPSVQDYIVEIAGATRLLDEARLGVSPRGSLALLRAARVHAAAYGRSYVVPEDVKALARSVLAHRVLVRPDAQLRGVTAEDLVGKVLAAVPVRRPVRA